jgi:hypothetical protein
MLRKKSRDTQKKHSNKEKIFHQENAKLTNIVTKLSANY